MMYLSLKSAETADGENNVPYFLLIFYLCLYMSVPRITFCWFKWKSSAVCGCTLMLIGCGKNIDTKYKIRTKTDSVQTE